MDSDEQVIKACLLARSEQSDDDSPWRQLCDRHFANVHGLALKMTGDATCADDLTQEVFLKVFRSLHQFDGNAKFSTWIFRIAMNTILSHFKSNRRLHPTAGESVEKVATKEQSAEQAATCGELNIEIDRQLKTMKPEFKAAIILTSFQNMTPGEAAEVVGCSRETFYWRLNQARNQLRENLSHWLQP